MKEIVKRTFQTFLVTIALFLVLLVVAWNYNSKVKESKVYPAVQELQSPLKNVRTAYYDDGGSRSIFIEDSRGEQLHVMLPHPISDISAHGKLFLGSYREGNEIDETMYPDTRRALLEIVENRSERQLEDLGVNWSLSQHALDKIRILTKSVLGYYKDDR